MILVGLTGGIGSGKSTVSALLARRGAVIIDADVITREVQRPGSPVLDKIAERFGSEVLDENGALDRPALAAVVFADAEALEALNHIVHPAVGAEIARRLEDERATDHVVILDVPLLTENPRDNLQGKIVVDVPVEVQVERLVRYRGFSEDDVRARIASQATREQRLQGADVVIDNGGTVADLEPQIDRAWQWLKSLPQLPPDFDYAASSKPRGPRVRMVGVLDDGDLEAAGGLLHEFNTEFGEPTPGAAVLGRRLRHLIAAGATTVHVVSDGRKPSIGVAVCRFRPALWDDAEECYLAELYVMPDRRDQGFGRALLERVLSDAAARGASWIDLGTSEDDVAARRLYERAGFVRTEGDGGPVMYVYERKLERPDGERRARLGRTIPALPVRVLDAALERYTQVFGFTVRHRDGGFAVLGRDGAEIHLWESADDACRRSPDGSPPVRSGAESFLAGTASCRIEVDDPDALFAELAPHGVLHGVYPDGPADTEFGTREFAAVDLDGNLLTFFGWR